MELEQEIYKLLTRKSYNRDEPRNIPGIEAIIINNIQNQQPIPFIGFWGVGPKAEPNDADRKTCEFLSKYKKEVEKIYSPGLSFHFIFATQHGIHNGIEKETISSYTNKMEKLFKEYDFTWTYLDNLWQKYDITFEKIESELSQKPTDWWQEIPNRELIEKNAQIRNHRLPFRDAAQFYFVMRNLEKGMLEKEYRGYIFNSFSDTKLLNVLPNMPILFFYGRKGWVNAPWFVM